jgi:hypothetical protein
MPVEDFDFAPLVIEKAALFAESPGSSILNGGCLGSLWMASKKELTK